MHKMYMKYIRYMMYNMYKGQETVMIYARNINRLKHVPERKVDSILG